MDDNMANINLLAALANAEVGLPIFPARAIFNSKTGKWNKPPYIQNWQSAASSDPMQIEEWWDQFPNAIPAIRCDSLVIVDADRHGDEPDGVVALGSLVNRFEEWPDHPVVLTPSNGEYHYFRQPSSPLGNGTGDLPHGIDIRGMGGFVIAPGAMRPDGTAWQFDRRLVPNGKNWVNSIPALPTWLEQKIRAEHTQPTAGHTYQLQVNGREERYAQSVLNSGTAEVENAIPGRRNTKLNGVAYRLGRMVGAGWIDRNRVEVELRIAARALERDDGLVSVTKTIKSGLDAGTSKPHPPLPDRGR
jgi:hypothetical protein